MTSIHRVGPGLAEGAQADSALQRTIPSPWPPGVTRADEEASTPAAGVREMLVSGSHRQGYAQHAPRPQEETMDKDEVRYIVVCVFAVPLIFWLLGPFVGLAALIVFAALFFVWREPDAPNRLPLLWEEHYEAQRHADQG